jgi:hypothetical protein
MSKAGQEEEFRQARDAYEAIGAKQPEPSRADRSARAWAAATGPFETRGEFGGGGREVWVVGEHQSAVAHITRRHDDAGPPEAIAAHIAAALNALGGHEQKGGS